MRREDFREVAGKVSTLCSKQSAIVAVYIFGSAAKGERQPSSDLDVAVLLDETRLDQFSLSSFISLVEKVCGYRADVVVLNRAGELLKYEVRRFGLLIFERDARRRKQFEVMGRKTFEDFLSLHRRYASRVLYGEKYG